MMKCTSSLPHLSIGILIVWIMAGGSPTLAQHFTDCLSPRDTGSDATVIVRDTVETLFPNDASLEEGDEIALYTSDGTCAGSVTWSSSDGDTSLSAAGPDGTGTDSGSSGYEIGEPLKVKVWDDSENEVYDLESIIQYESCEDKSFLCREDGAYEEGAIYSIIQLGNSETLPVELVEFNAITDKNRVRLEWTTASESRNVGFDVQHRTPETPWSTLEFVEGAGQANDPQHYSHTVTNLETGRHLFRLRQTDADGSTVLSSPISVELSMDEAYELGRVSPNPLRPHGQLVLRIRDAQAVTVSVFNTLGQRVRTLHQGLLSANKTHVFSLDGSSLSSGRYLIRIQGETFSETRPMTVLK